MKTYRAKKSLGQNFLKSSLALTKIIEAGEISPDDIILEIGPGKGALTKKLLERVYPPNSRGGQGKVIAVEKDHELIEILKVKFEKEIKSGTLVLVHEDILKFDINNYKLKTINYKLIANIPYNITGAILKKFLTAEHQPERMVLLAQNEVAKRIVARDGKESILSISVKAYGTPKIIMKVPARYFSPAPKVDSAIIAITDISRKNFTSPPAPLQNTILERGGMRIGGSEGEKLEEKFFEILRAGFAHKRKKLSSNLKKLVSCGSTTSARILAGLENKRAEELSLKDWIELAKMIQ